MFSTWKLRAKHPFTGKITQHISNQFVLCVVVWYLFDKADWSFKRNVNICENKTSIEQVYQLCNIAVGQPVDKPNYVDVRLLDLVKTSTGLIANKYNVTFIWEIGDIYEWRTSLKSVRLLTL